ncbi:MAG: bifunctional oligoribonuclease/PAP phosphatase NrnA [Eubacterium sp.]|nr:bifunctional oligoribonuclease/PAP phosphatase NrnA [Eubacterium sp.]MDD7208718.1 bifunctional oligoribonuclease/PAP phosphatase NrnA [Lachnospiraceae bacterium]MDY5497745.1 bifunctional oligoribonuclease/PAP phosphatase NrnA [Anaerobutyricum sp.]
MITGQKGNRMLSERKAELVKQIKRAHTIGISGHTNPDGDCIGSCLGLYTYLKEMYPEKQIDLYLEPIPDKFSFLKYAEDICQEKTLDGAYDLYFSLDCSEPDRLDRFRSFFEEAEYQICIDHHFTNTGFGDLRFIFPEASSTCEVLCDLLDMDRVSMDCARDLYMGIVHDTGVFKHTNTTRKTMETAGILLEKGIHSEEIIDRTFFRKTYVQNQILGRALMQSILLLDGKVIFSVISKKDIEFYGIESADLDGIIDQLRVTEGVECALLLHEKEEGVYKVSMRANDLVDVSEIAGMFGGGGHIKAAGCTVHGESRDIVMNITHMVEQQLIKIKEEAQESVYDKRNS